MQVRCWCWCWCRCDCGCGRGWKWLLRCPDWKGQLSPKLQLQELPPSSVHAGPLWKLSLHPPGAPKHPGVCCVRYDANLRQHDRARALTLKDCPISWTDVAFVPCTFTPYSNRTRKPASFGIGQRIPRWSSSQWVPALWSAGDPRIGRHLTGPRPVPWKVYCCSSVRGRLAGWQEGRGALGAQPGLDMKPEREHAKLPTSRSGILPSTTCYAAIPPPSKLSPDVDTFNPKRTPPALAICTRCASHPITPQDRGVTILTWLDASTRSVSSPQSLCGNLQHAQLRCLHLYGTPKVYL